MIIKNIKDYINSITEGIIKTYPGDKVLSDVLKSLKILHLEVNGDFVNSKIKLSINKFNFIPLNQIGNIFDHIDTFVVNRGGWFPSTMTISKLTSVSKSSKYNFDDIIRIHDEIDSVEIEYESKFDTEEINIPDRLYHLTIKEYEKKINRFGLIPRSKSKLTSHLDRIYVCLNYQDCIDLIPQMMFYYTGEKDDNIYKFGKKLFKKDLTPIIYEIDNSSNFIDKLYLDINYDKKGYYILNNIQPSNLKKNNNQLCN
jgi:hypothetical protein